MAGVDRTASIALFLLVFISGVLFLDSAVTDPLDLSALRALYGALGGPAQLTGWNYTGGDPCGGEHWRGVTCDGASVTSIEIEGLGIGGFLGLQLSSFLSLKHLDVSCNNIGGEIPHALPPNATHINLAVNNFTGGVPSSLPSLKALNHLNISHNALSGPIGNVFTDMQSLEILDLSFNQFTGDLPSSFSSLSNLHMLYLQDNQFTGSVSFLANLPLSTLYLQNNKFSGFLPKQFEFIPHLRINGNLFQSGYALPPHFTNGSGNPTLSSADKNVSHSPLDTLGSFGFSSIEVHPHSHRRWNPEAIAGITCGVLLVVSLAMAVPTIHILKFHKSKLHCSKSTEEALHVLPTTLPSVTAGNVVQWTTGSPAMTSVRLPSVRHLRREGMCRRKSSTKRLRNLQTAKLYSASELVVATSSFNEDNLIGEGPFGRVYRAEFPEGQVLAVKKVDMIALAIYEEEDFLDVVWKMSCLRHPNITSLLGYCVEQGEHFLVYEYARNGSLDDALFSASRTCKTLSWKDRVRIAHGVAQALEYMHWICSPPVAHENIKAKNILLNDDLMPRITDCGLTLLRHLIRIKSKASDQPTGFSGYSAPEQSRLGMDKIKSDIYSYGVVLLELLTGRRAFDSSRRKEEQNLARWASFRLHDFFSLEDMVDPAIRGSISSKALSHFADIISLCIQPEPEFRCPTAEVVKKLAHLLQSMGEHVRASSGGASEIDASDLSFKTTLGYFEQPSRSV